MIYLDAINFGSKILKQNDIISYSLDSELILANILNSTREKILTSLDKKIAKQTFNKFKKQINRRKLNEPVAYIINKKFFWKYEFYVNKNVLIPRPDTEIIIEEVLKITKEKTTKKLLDVGTGSGCLIISILNERPNFYGKAIDISKKALNVAKYNAKMHHLENKISFINIDIDKFNDNKYDLIISNPPYINRNNLMRLEDNVKLFEPHLALEAGVDGLREIKKVIKKSKNLLKKNGKLIFEIGINQLNKSKNILTKNGFYINKVSKDISSIPRLIVCTKL